MARRAVPTTDGTCHVKPDLRPAATRLPIYLHNVPSPDTTLNDPFPIRNLMDSPQMLEDKS
jgi:hypothetical protein